MAWAIEIRGLELAAEGSSHLRGHAVDRHLLLRPQGRRLQEAQSPKSGEVP
jgi:hypothetical protein